MPEGRTVVASLGLEPGMYQITGKVLLTSSQEQVPQVTTVACQLTPSREEPDAPPADHAALLLARAAEPGSAGTMTFGLSQKLTQSGSVVLACFGDQTDVASAPVASNAWIRAIEVASPAPLTPSP